MLARGRRRPRTYKSADHYLNRINTYHTNQKRLKTKLVDKFGHREEDQTVLTGYFRIKGSSI